MLILGIETSCDDSAAGIFCDGEVLSSVVCTQEVHRKWGGVIPELASREHARSIIPVVEEALERAGVGLDDLDGIAACAGPGLLGSLLVGLCVGKAMARVLDIPLAGVHHLEGHFFAAISTTDAEPPLLAIIVSGGHSHIYFVPEFGRYELLGRTRDDAAGEAFDKGAKAIGLPYPGGPSIEKAAVGGDPAAFHFPRAMRKSGELDMSFSGLKTSLLNKLDEFSRDEIHNNIADIAASYQEAIVDALVWKIREAGKGRDFGGRIVAVGGVAANLRFREKLKILCEEMGWKLYIPPTEFCTDNGAMIAAAGAFRIGRDCIAPWDITAVSRWSLEEL